MAIGTWAGVTRGLEAKEKLGLILGKALGGGLLPISLFLGRREMLSLMTSGSHWLHFWRQSSGVCCGLRSHEIYWWGKSWLIIRLK